MKKRERMKQGFLFIMVMIMFVISGSGCSQQRQQTITSVPENQTELEVWICYDRNVVGSYYVFLWDTLAEEYGYTLDIKNYSQREIKDKLRMAMACNELPDIFYVPGSSFSETLFDAGACLPIQRYLLNADFKESYTEPYKDGNNYVIPCVPRSYAVVYYDRDLMQRMGLEIPKTWDDLLAVVRRVNEYNYENNTDYAAIELGEKDDSMGSLLYCLLAQSLDPQTYHDMEKGNPIMTDEPFTEAAKYMSMLISRHAFPDDFLEIGEPEAVKNFINHDAVMMIHDTSLVYHLMQNMGRDNFMTASFPSCSGEYYDIYEQYLMDMNDTYVPGLAVSTRSEHKKEAAKLCVDFADRINQINVEQNGALNISDKKIEYTGSVLTNIKKIHDLTENAEQTDSYLYAVLPQDKGDSWGNITKQFMAGELTVERFMEESTRLFSSSE